MAFTPFHVDAGWHGLTSQIFGPDVETFPFDAASGRDEDARTEFGLDGLGNDLQLSGRGRNS